MIPGVTPVAAYAVGELPDEFDLSVPDPLAAILADPHSSKTYLLVAAPYDPVALALTTLRFSNNGYATKPTDAVLPNELFKNRLVRPLNIQTSVLSGGRLRPSALPSFGEIEIVNQDRVNRLTGLNYGDLDHILEYSWPRRALTVLVGTDTFDYSSFGAIFNGTAEEVTWDQELIKLRLRGYEYRLQKAIQATKYHGFGAAIRLDGVDDYLSGSVTCPAGTVTISARVRPAALNTTVQAIAGWRNGTSAGLRILTLDGVSNNRPVFSVRNDAGTLFEAIAVGTAVPAGSWTHISGRLSMNAMQISVLVDGVSLAVTGVTGTFNTVLGTLAIGRLSDSASLFFNGDVDEPRVWSSFRLTAQTFADRNRELIGNEADLAYYNRLNDGAGATATATVGTNLTLNGGAAWIGSGEGGADVAGKPKPLAYGPFREARLVLVDSQNLVYQRHDRAMQAISTVKDQGVALTPAGDVVDLYATTVTAGQYKTDLARGLVRLGTKPAGELTCDGQGDNVGGYVYTAADIIRRIVSRHGGLADPAEIDAGAIARANTANSAVHSYVTDTEPENIDEIVGKLAFSIGAWWGYTRPGLFTLKRLDAPGTPVGTLAEKDIRLGGVRRLPSAPVSKSQRLGYRRNWITQRPDALAGSLSAEEKRLLGETYRYATAPGASSVETAYSDAEEISNDTYMDTLADAQTEADRRQALWGVPRDIYSVPLANGLFAYNIGETWTLAIPRFGLNSGKPGVIVGITEDVAADEVVLEMWVDS